MGLRAQAASDAKKILNDDTNGAGVAINLYDPTAPTVAVAFVGWSNDIALLIDPDTDDYISGRRATVALSLTDILAAGLSGVPDHVPDTTGRPWVVAFDDLNGTTHTFKVAKSHPDRGVNLLVLDLEVYQ